MHEVRRLPGPAGATLADGLLDQLLTDLLPELSQPSQPSEPLDADAAPRSLEAHREHARAWYGHLIGPLGVPAAAVPSFVDSLRPGDHALRIILLGPWSPAPQELMRAARAQLLDDDRIELAGVELSLPVAPEPAQAAELALTQLDVSAPSWLRIPADPGWIEALDVIAEDGAERVAVVLPDPSGDDAHRQLAAVIQSVASRGVRFSVATSPGAAGLDLVSTASSYGLLNLLGAIATAAEAAAVADLDAIGDNGVRLTRLAELLADTDHETVIGAARRIGPQSTAAIRRVLDRIECTSVRVLISDLAAAGLIVPDVA